MEERRRKPIKEVAITYVRFPEEFRSFTGMLMTGVV
jgi:hypothetical protein